MQKACGLECHHWMLSGGWCNHTPGETLESVCEVAWEAIWGVARSPMIEWRGTRVPSAKCSVKLTAVCMKDQG